jgi:hypothetical protein
MDPKRSDFGTHTPTRYIETQLQTGGGCSAGGGVLSTTMCVPGGDRREAYPVPVPPAAGRPPADGRFLPPPPHSNLAPWQLYFLICKHLSPQILALWLLHGFWLLAAPSDQSPYH